MSAANVIGNQEWCRFEQLQIPAIKARVDSGAKTSSIQAINIKRYFVGGEAWVEFEVNPIQDNRSIAVRCHAKIIDTRMVKSSSGVAQKRYVIKTPLEIGNHSFDIELTLANRDAMDFHMLLGREAMSHFMINPTESFLLGNYTESEAQDF